LGAQKKKKEAQKKRKIGAVPLFMKAAVLLFALELAPSKISPIFCTVTFHLYLTEFLSSRLKSGTIEIL
jgi:hypothetical protein